MPPTPLMRAGRRRATWARLTLMILVSSLMGAPRADASDLEHRKGAVERQIDSAGRHLDQSSAELVQAVKAVERGRDSLVQARDSRAAAQRVLVTAQERHRLARRALASARIAEAAVEEQVQTAQAEVQLQLNDLRGSVVQAVQGPSPSLLTLSSVLTSQTAGDVTRQTSLGRAALESADASLQRLEAAQSILQADEKRLEAAVTEVSSRKSIAADQVTERQQALSRARDAELSVRSAVERLRAQRERASAARAEDQARMKELRQERARVRQLLQRRAERALAREEDRQRLIGGNGALTWPVQGYVSSPFGMRFHPVYKRWSLHDGTDIAAPCGRPVRAAAGGRVVSAYYNSSYGNRIIIDNGLVRSAGLATTYNHMSGFATSVGERVRRGQVIGFVGNTGASTGCHVHFMVLIDGRPVEPMDWL